MEAIETRQETNVEATSVKGWGVDADPENDPAYPMKERKPGLDHAGYSWERPEQQFIGMEVLRSNERPNVSSTFGTSVPPSGLSGVLRRAAFNYSEDSYGHWLPLMLADRVQMVEGVIDDISRGHVPNVFGEMGWKADWKYNRKALVTKVAIGTAIGVGLWALLARRRSSNDH
ncbi:MAG: hypothetical protein PSX80_13950 [bacterium]|nr:hypothetical protein [bacterium]